MSFTAFEIPGPYFNASGGPATAFYYQRLSETSYRPWLDDAEACAAIPVAVRAGLTISVANVEKQWLSTDTSNAGLVRKTAGGAGAGLDAHYFTGNPGTGQVTFALTQENPT